MDILTVLVVLLLLGCFGSFPAWGWSHSWGYGPSGGMGLILIIVIILLFQRNRRD